MPFEAFKKAQETYKSVKEAISQKWEGFKKKFEGTKSEMANEVMNAKTPEDLIALGKKLQEQGESLQSEQLGIETEETGEDDKFEKFQKEDYENDFEAATKENEQFDEAKAAKEANRQAGEDASKVTEDEAAAAKLLEQIKNGNLKKETKNENKEYYEEAKNLLNNLFDDGKKEELDPFWNRVSEEQEKDANKLKELFKELNQSSLAQEFFNETIGKSISNNKGAYMVYGLLKGTEFANKFKELESARLEKEGYGKFDL
jgi:hypothetical protein